MTGMTDSSIKSKYLYTFSNFLTLFYCAFDMFCVASCRVFFYSIFRCIGYYWPNYEINTLLYRYDTKKKWIIHGRQCVFVCVLVSLFFSSFVLGTFAINTLIKHILMLQSTGHKTINCSISIHFGWRIVKIECKLGINK